ncbi:flavin monoamine oxidase family protein [Paraflavitalea pollutisoli]|uniref:flavin monoamine oxidase family protein n=1 Tax=Paraflavitalea pollutisoli TaxID=3034143 RepID=UPI0023EDB277|nr:flavin monoamine oxidase family protein [Paraflavitalea sp. H1-2-19X]
MNQLTRRKFLQHSSRLAGGAYPAMMALGLLKEAPAHAFDLPSDPEANREHVIILGAGLAGMTAAYELQKLGYRCTLLEARNRSGGRCWSVRKGSVHTETGTPTQQANFDDGLYFNAGPSRIPHNHQLSLHYCKELGVPLQVYNNVNESAYYFSEGKGPLSNKKVRVREVHNDVRGYLSELLAKAVDSHAVDAALSKEDAQKVVEYLRAEGGLDIDKLYKASARRGYIEQPGAGEKAGRIAEPHTLAALVGSGLLDPDFYNVAEYTYELQMTMFQAVGGMEVIAQHFEKKLQQPIRYQAEVTAIHNTEKGVQIIYKTPAGAQRIDGDYCICTIPLPVLSNIDHDFSSAVSRAIDYANYIKTGKIGLQFKRRFWEEDENIYGGITHTNNELTQIFYPSNDYLGKKGMLIGYYNFNEKARVVGDLTYAEREKLALAKGRLIHPQYDTDFERSFSVSWHKTQYNLGGWSVYTSEDRQTHYKALLTPDKRTYFAGEHTTYLNSWMAGAFESARQVTAALHGRISEKQLTYPKQ